MTHDKFWSDYEGEPFYLNGGFFIYKADELVTTIDIGCGCNKWYVRNGGSMTQEKLLSKVGNIEVWPFLERIQKRRKE